MSPEFELAVAGMRALPQWFVWRLVWDGENGKYRKVPCQLNGADAPMDASKPANWSSYEVAVAALRVLPQVPELRYTLGFYVTAQCPYWFLDIDHCYAGDALNPWARAVIDAYPGAMVERTSSGNGVHVIGCGPVPEKHRSKPPRDIAVPLKPMELEFYTQMRGIAFGLDGLASGSADSVHDMTTLVDTYFPAREEVDPGSRPEWRGPDDDDVLIERMLAARLSAEAAFGGKPSAPMLWRGDCERNSENDMALAAHLAFWTGCDEPRMERIMARSGMVRDKWSDSRPGGNYLTHTIHQACMGCDNVYQEPVRDLVASSAAFALPGSEATVTRIAPETFAKADELVAMVSACGTADELYNVVLPALQSASIPKILQERIVLAVQATMKLFGDRMPLASLRTTLFAPVLAKDELDVGMMPEWAKPFAFCSNGDQFFNTNNGQYMSMVGFQAVFGRMMPVNDQGRRENACERALHFWKMPLVEQIGYRPDCGPFYTWEQVDYANMYSPSSLPTPATAYTEAGTAGIVAFQAMLFDMCGRREDVYYNMLHWFAHNVQHPGVKIRWSPVLKGVHGDGKTLACAVLRSAMGYRNVSTTSNSNISNSGGFTDWAVRGAVNVIEEIMLTGKVRHQLYNAMKEFLTNDIVDINPKGAKPYQAYNITNHIALTNHNDALPMEKTDRRWMVVFTPWASLAGMAAYCGLTAAGWKERTDAIDRVKRDHAGELRSWFLSIAIPATFDINGSAPMTPEKMRMMGSSADNADTVAMSVIMEGALGVTENVISSAHLSRVLDYRAQIEGLDKPKGLALNHMFTRMGYSKLDKQVKWMGSTHTIWLKDGVELDNDQIRLALDNSNPTQT